MKGKIKSLPGEGSQTCSHIEPSTEQNLLRAVGRRHSSTGEGPKLITEAPEVASWTMKWKGQKIAAVKVLTESKG